MMNFQRSLLIIMFMKINNVVRTFLCLKLKETKDQLICCSPVCKQHLIARKSRSGESICCIPVVCLQGQKYNFCDQDQGHDTCSSCPDGTYHLDRINTAVMYMVIDPCIQKPTCEQPEVILENERCVCDRSRGYYGNDENNCFLADVMCSTPGFELKNNGLCGRCENEYFKAEASAEYICKPKTRCLKNQEINSNGSSTTDRTCRRKKISLKDLKPLHQFLETNKSTSSNNKDNSVLTLKIAELEKRINIIELDNLSTKEELRKIKRKLKNRGDRRGSKLKRHKKGSRKDKKKRQRKQKNNRKSSKTVKTDLK